MFSASHGFKFANDFPEVPIYMFHLPLIGNISLADASNGLCGGMVWAALDYYLTGTPLPADTTPPDKDSPLYRYICRRLIQSFDAPFGIAKYYSWMCSGDDRVVENTLENELPAILMALSIPQPVPLGLVYSSSMNPKELGKNHQVLAYAFAKRPYGTSIKIYDPNQPNVESEISCLTDKDANKIVACGTKCRGFFRTNYSPSEPWHA